MHNGQQPLHYMKNVLRLFGIIALVAVTGFGMVACDDGGNGGGGGDRNNIINLS
jgi:hypothetical protein